jgi:hypothetical protein
MRIGSVAFLLTINVNIVSRQNHPVLLGSYAIYRQWRGRRKAESTDSLSYIALIIVGIGSAIYHASLKYTLQLGTTGYPVSFSSFLCLPFLCPLLEAISSSLGEEGNEIKREWKICWY